MPERSFHFKGRKFPLCARCTGVFLGYSTLSLFHLGVITPNLLLITVFSLPMLIDSLTQSYGVRESNNILRLMTGFMFGASQAALIVLIGNFLVSLISIL